MYVDENVTTKRNCTRGTPSPNRAVLYTTYNRSEEQCFMGCYLSLSWLKQCVQI